MNVLINVIALFNHYMFWSHGPSSAVTQNHWVFGLHPSSGILKTWKYSVSENGSVLRWRGKHILLRLLQKADLNHWTTRVKVKSQSYVTTDGYWASMSWCKHPSEAQDGFYYRNSCGFVDVGRPLWRENRSVVYNCYWSLQAKSFSGTSPSGLSTIFFCLAFETPSIWWVRLPYLHAPGTGAPVIPPGIGLIWATAIQTPEIELNREEITRK
jgi:hypothetical protein